MIWIVTAVVPAHATETSRGIDAVLVMDSSGSMKTSDPQMRRVSAARLLVSLLGETDRVGVISFSDDGYPIAGLTAARSKGDHGKLLNAIGRISARGAHTNLHAALLRAQEMLQRDGASGRPQYVVLLTDGKMDTGRTEQDTALTRQIREVLLPQYAKAGIRIYAFAFTAQSETALLREMAEQTAGLFRVVQTDQDLHSRFLTAFEAAKQPDMLPVEGGTFRIDTAIAEVTVVVLKENPKVRTVLADPAGRRFMATQAESGIQWLVTERFDMITVTRPKAGVWELVANGERGHAYVITDMKLATNVGKHDAAVAGTAVQAWLSRDGQVLTQAEILANTRFTAEILRPDGTATELVLAPRGQSGDGIYSGVTGAEAPGNYEVRLSAQSPTFARKVTRYFSVAPAAPGVKAGTTTAAPKPAVAADQEGRETKAALTTPDQPAPVTNSKPATAAKRKSKAAAASPASPEKSGSGEINLWVVLAAFTGINLVLGGIGVGVYWWLRKKSIKSGLTRFLEPGQESMAAMDKQGAPEVAKA